MAEDALLTLLNAELLETKHTLLVAVSGGSDSLSMLYMLHQWQGAHAKFTKLICATVDHGLRAEAKDEVAFVAEHCAKLCIPHLALELEVSPPKSSLMAWAREQRYAVLCESARNLDAAICVAHTLDDQIETLKMRLKRYDDKGPSSLGLAGIPTTITHQGVRILRPLLHSSRSSLRGYLKKIGVSDWVEDPSNSDNAYERGQMRSIASDDTASFAIGDAPTEKLLHFAKVSKRWRAAVNRTTADLLSTHVDEVLPQVFRINRIGFGAYPIVVQSRALGLLSALSGGQGRFSAGTMVTSLAQKMTASNFKGASLSGARIDGRRKGEFFIYRENRHIADNLKNSIWDGRFLCLGQKSVSILGREEAIIRSKQHLQETGMKVPWEAFETQPSHDSSIDKAAPIPIAQCLHRFRPQVDDILLEAIGGQPASGHS